MALLESMPLPEGRDVDMHVAYPFVREVALRCRHAKRAFSNLRSELAKRSQLVTELQAASQAMLDQAKATGELDSAAYDAAKVALNDVYDPIFLNVETFLINAANVSKLLWISSKSRAKPENTGWAQRCDDLRAELGLSGTYMIESPDFRNDLEHFDSRLDELIASGDLTFADMNILPLGSGYKGATPKQSLRHLDENTMIFSFYEKPFDLGAALTEIEDIESKASAWLASHQLRP